jgi:hypothetical protein
MPALYGHRTNTLSPSTRRWWFSASRRLPSRRPEFAIIAKSGAALTELGGAVASDSERPLRRSPSFCPTPQTWHLVHTAKVKILKCTSQIKTKQTRIFLLDWFYLFAYITLKQSGVFL